jgi:hypothetical protein
VRKPSWRGSRHGEGASLVRKRQPRVGVCGKEGTIAGGRRRGSHEADGRCQNNAHRGALIVILRRLGPSSFGWRAAGHPRPRPPIASLWQSGHEGAGQGAWTQYEGAQSVEAWL